MKPSELRRFHSRAATRAVHLSDVIFVVVRSYEDHLDVSKVDILIDGTLERGWLSSFVAYNSEVIGETG